MDEQPEQPSGKTVSTQAQEIYEDLKDKAGDSMDFILTRAPEKQRAGTSFSEEALEELVGAFRAFLFARIHYHWEQRDGGSEAVGPSVIRTQVKMTIDGEHVEPADDVYPWYVVDGQGRRVVTVES